jgi:glyoxylase-like metal-dependent hydrolase (beta-lactamase superfamily II)
MQRRAASAPLLLALPAAAHTSPRLDRSDLGPVALMPAGWGLLIMVLLGQAEAIRIVAPNGDVVLIESGRENDHGSLVADVLGEPGTNGVGALTTIDLLYTTYYDADHIGGIDRLAERSAPLGKASEQGRSP